MRRRTPLNSVALISMAVMLECFWIAEQSAENTNGFRLGMTLLGVLFGLIGYRSFRIYGAVIGKVQG